MKFKAVKYLQEGMNGADPKWVNTNDTVSVDFMVLYLDVAVFTFSWLKLKQSIITKNPII